MRKFSKEPHGKPVGGMNTLLEDKAGSSVSTPGSPIASSTNWDWLTFATLDHGVTSWLERGDPHNGKVHFNAISGALKKLLAKPKAELGARSQGHHCGATHVHDPELRGSATIPQG
jgi:hypothetical protein